MSESDDGSSVLRLTALGPIIINSDGTTSLIANYGAMTKEEQERTVRMIKVRNKKRVAELRAQGVEIKYDDDNYDDKSSEAGDRLQLENA